MIATNQWLHGAICCSIVALVLGSLAGAQSNPEPSAAGNSGQASGNSSQGSSPPASAKPAETNAASQDPELKKTLKDIQDYLKAQQQDESDFGLVLGIGSLLTSPSVTDYENQSNVLNVAHLGKATPQYLTGVSFRTRVPSLFTRFGCPGKPRQKRRQGNAKGTQAANGAGSLPAASGTPASSAVTDTAGKQTPGCYGEIWQRNPWNAFVSLKFAPGASNPINGYVLGGSFNLAHHLAFVVGFALTPVSEPSPGFRTVAAQFVQKEQQQGLYMQFDPTAMLQNAKNAFDGFPLTNPTTGALIYPGNALATHYHGGVVIGISMPIAFSSFLKSGGGAPTSPTAGAGASQ